MLRVQVCTLTVPTEPHPQFLSFPVSPSQRLGFYRSYCPHLCASVSHPAFRGSISVPVFSSSLSFSFSPSPPPPQAPDLPLLLPPHLSVLVLVHADHHPQPGPVELLSLVCLSQPVEVEGGDANDLTGPSQTTPPSLFNFSNFSFRALLLEQGGVSPARQPAGLNGKGRREGESGCVRPPSPAACPPPARPGPLYNPPGVHTPSLPGPCCSHSQTSPPQAEAQLTPWAPPAADREGLKTPPPGSLPPALGNPWLVGT